MTIFSQKNTSNLIKKLVITQLIIGFLAGFLIPTIPAKAAEPLVISNITVIKTGNSATITWQTNRPAYGKLEYGLYSHDYKWSLQTNQKTTQQSMTIFGLSSETNYYFRITANDEASQVSSFEQSFKTLKSSDNKSPLISKVSAVYTTGSTATIQWQTDEPATSEVEYGLTTSYGSTRSDGRLVNVHDLTVSGLKDGTYYHYRVKSKDKDNNVSIWYDLTFQTKLTNHSDLDALIIYGITPTSENDINITETTALITWRTNKLAEGAVRYGTSSSYGKTVTTNPPRDFIQSVTLTGLIPNTTYYFEIEAKDVLGRKIKSGNYSFTTKSGSGTYLPQILGASTDELLVYLPFNEGRGDITYDQSFNDNNGILDPLNPPVWAEGSFGQALDFLGNKENVKVPDNATIRFEKTLSILAWVKIRSYGQYKKIVTKEDAYELILGPYDGTLRLALFPEGAHDWVWLNSPGRPLEKDKWHFVAGTYDGNTMRIYVDAQKVGEINKPMNINNSTHPLYIGGNVADNKEWFDGLIDDVAVFNYALTPDQIATIYANGLTRYLEFAGIPTRGSGGNNNQQNNQTGTVLGVSNMDQVGTNTTNYVCNPNLGYTKFKALYKTADSPDIWAILETGQKHYITSPEAFAKYQCNWSAVKTVSKETLSRYTNANLVRTPADPAIYHLFQRPDRKWLKINIPSPTVFISYSSNYWGNVARVDALDIAAYPDAKLVKTKDSSNVYLLEGSKKRLIKSTAVFEANNFEWAEVVELNQIHLDYYEDGPVVD